MTTPAVTNVQCQAWASEDNGFGRPHTRCEKEAYWELHDSWEESWRNYVCVDHVNKIGWFLYEEMPEKPTGRWAIPLKVAIPA